MRFAPAVRSTARRSTAGLIICWWASRPGRYFGNMLAAGRRVRASPVRTKRPARKIDESPGRAMRTALSFGPLMKALLYAQRVVPVIGAVSNRVRFPGLWIGLRVEISGPGDFIYGKEV